MEFAKFKLPDLLKHFKDDPPPWKLAALIVFMTPVILFALAHLLEKIR